MADPISGSAADNRTEIADRKAQRAGDLEIDDASDRAGLMVAFPGLGIAPKDLVDAVAENTVGMPSAATGSAVISVADPRPSWRSTQAEATAKTD